MFLGKRGAQQAEAAMAVTAYSVYRASGIDTESPVAV